MKPNNAKKMAQLGMPYGTACHRLRKMVLFQLLVETGKNVCFQCSGAITSCEDLSIEHKEPWLDKDPDLFWDLANIGFSHLSCNVQARRSRPEAMRQSCPEGSAWCSGCKQCLRRDRFHGSRNRWNGCHHYCVDCREARKTRME